MHDMFLHIVTVFMGFFAIMNPFANTPIFLALTDGDDEATRKKIARKALILALAIVILFSALGKVIFEFFGITLPAFRITGGILVFLIGYHMLQGNTSPMHHPANKEDMAKNGDSRLSVAIAPLGVPILAGPGTIATAMNYAAGGDIWHPIVTVVCFFVLAVITYSMFVSGQKLVRFMGQGTMKVITRMMGLILAVIGTQMLIGGVSGAIQMASK